MTDPDNYITFNVKNNWSKYPCTILIHHLNLLTASPYIKYMHQKKKYFCKFVFNYKHSIGIYQLFRSVDQWSESQNMYMKFGSPSSTVHISTNVYIIDIDILSQY